jgi:hypothetical protein
VRSRHDLDMLTGVCREACGVAGDHAHRRAAVDESLEHLAADLAGGSGDNDHVASQTRAVADLKDRSDQR